MVPETPRTSPRNGDLLVETRGLTKRYRSRIAAVTDLDLTVR